MVSTKPEFGKISSEDHKAIDNCVHDLVYATREVEYEEKKRVFQGTCSHVDFEASRAYMEKNWFTCAEMWVLYHRDKLPHFKNHTNNRLENWFGKFKSGIADDASMSECVSELVAAGRRCQNDYEYLLQRPGQHYNAQYDREMQSVLSLSTPFVAKAIEPQYVAAKNKWRKYVYEEDPNDHFVIVKGTKYDNVVDTTSWTCGCDFSKTMLLPCRHAMAYRRHKGFPEMIPLSRLDIRWKRAVSAPLKVKQFTLNPADESSSPRRASKLDWTQANSACRYNEALRRLQPICSELAKIQDEEEFHEYLTFLEDQFRNVRKRKRTGRIEGEEPDDAPASPASASRPTQVELSQANSLWDPDFGDLPEPTFHTLRIPKPDDLIADDAESALHTPRGAKALGHGPDMAGGGADMDTSGDFEEKGEVVEEATAGEVRAEDFPIVINENAARSGRPKLDKTAIVAAQRQDRVLFKATEKARHKFGELTLEEVVRHAEKEQLPPTELEKRLAGIQVRHEAASNKKPVYQELSNPTLNKNAYYILPKPLLDACISQLPVATRPGEAIRVSTPDIGSAQPSQGESGAQKRGKGIECVSIKDVGIFSRSQIELMCRVAQLKKAAKQGTQMVSWLRNDAASEVSAEVQPVVISLADQLEKLYPFAHLPDLPLMSDYHVAALYKLRAPKWLGDGLIAAFCDRLSRVYDGVRYVGFVRGSKKKPRGGHTQRLEASIVEKMKELKLHQAATTLLLPVNFGEWHWTAIYVDLKRKTLNYYDSNESCFPGLESLLTSLDHADIGDAPFKDFTRVKVKSPFQVDGFSCGVFVCHKFWRYLDKTISNDMSEKGLFARRVEILHFVLRNSKIPRKT